jgi:hypothetical protein
VILIGIVAWFWELPVAGRELWDECHSLAPSEIEMQWAGAAKCVKANRTNGTVEEHCIGITAEG